MPKISSIHKLSKNKAFTWNEHFLSTQNGNFTSEINHFVSLNKLTKNLLQFQNKQIQNLQIE